MTAGPSPFLRVHRLLLGLTVCAVLTLAQCGVALAHGHGDHHGDRHGNHHGGALFVSPGGTRGSSDSSCDTAGYSTIQAAVNDAKPRGVVIVCPGTYTENVVISQPLKLIGLDGATVHGSSTPPMACDQFIFGPTGPPTPVTGGPCYSAITITSSSVKVTGLTVTGAAGEGILATGSLMGGSISDVEISDNHVVNNDVGGIPPLSPYWECQPNGQVPGDCGEGIHLMAVYDSVVGDNYVSGNSGGVLLTDEFGPTHNNRIVDNVITNNLYDCGVTAPGHNPMALDAHGNRQPSLAGVYDNVIANNRITGNGVKGEGAGVLFANAAPGSASYDNLVVHNYIAGNDLAGVTLHAHPIPPGTFEDLNGNRIIKNVIGTNNTGGDPDAGVTAHTTGILVFGAVPVTITIAGNRIFRNDYGIWLGTGGNITAKLRHNRFFGVGTPVFTQS